MAKKKLQPITINDLLAYRFPGNLQYSPDGKYIAFQCSRPDGVKNDYRQDVWLVQDGKAKQLTYSLDTTVAFWENEETLIVQRVCPEAACGTSSLFAIDMQGGEALPWQVLPFPLKQIKKVREGVYAALGMIDANDPDAYLDDEKTRDSKAAAREAEKDYTVVDEVPYWFNGSYFTNKKRTALFLVDRKKNTVKRLTDPFEDVQSMIVSDGTVYIISETYQRKSTVPVNSVYSFNATGRRSTVYAKGDIAFSSLFVRGGKLYTMASDMQEMGYGQTADICRLEKNKVIKLLDPHRQFGNHVASDMLMGTGTTAAETNDEWFTIVMDYDHAGIWKYDRDFNCTVVHEQPGVVSLLDACNGKVVFAWTGAAAPTEIYEMNADGTDVRQLSNLNTAAMKHRYAALPESVEFTSEGWDLRGWVLKPYNYDPKKKYPAVLEVHGGPRAAYGETFYHEMQVLASKGYFVFFANIVGSDGRDDVFGDLRGKYGDIDYKNVMDFTDAVVEKYPAIDQTKLCVTGGSYGGFMTNWIIGHTDRFCAAASQRSIASWISMTFIADIGLWFDGNEMGIPLNDSLFDHFDTMWKHSPLKYMKGAKTPTLFIHSDQDCRCPLPEGMQMMQSLAYQDVETRLVIFHGEHHGLSRVGKPQHRIRRLEEIAGWFDKHTN